MLLTYTFVQTGATWWSTTLTRKRTQLVQSTYHCYLGALIEWYVFWKRVPSGPHLLLHKHKSGKNGEFWEAGLHWFIHRVRIFSDTPKHRYVAEAGSWWFFFSYCPLFFLASFHPDMSSRDIMGEGSTEGRPWQLQQQVGRLAYGTTVSFIMSLIMLLTIPCVKFCFTF